MTAIDRWNHMVRIEHEQSDRMRGPTPPPADHWTEYAREFRADPRRTSDPVMDHLLERVSPGQTVIDVGAGGGRLALPLALHCRRVVAVEPSPSMGAVLREAAAEFDVPNVDVVESDWKDAAVDQADVILCSHVVYVVREIGEFVRKLDDRLRLGIGSPVPSGSPVPVVPIVGNCTPGTAASSSQSAPTPGGAGRVGNAGRRNRPLAPTGPRIR